MSVTFAVALWRPESYFRWVEPWLRLEQERHDAEIVLVSSGKSIFSAYQKAREVARHDIVVYVHDDACAIEPETVTPYLVDYFRRRRKVALIGPAGKSARDRVPWWLNTGPYVGHWCRFGSSPGEVVYQWAETDSNLCSFEALASNWVRPQAPSEAPELRCATCKRAPCSCDTLLLQRRALRRVPPRAHSSATRARLEAQQEVAAVSGYRAIADKWLARPEDQRWNREADAGLVDGFFLAEHSKRMPDWSVDTYGDRAWHGYDMDRCFQAHDAGYMVGVTPLLFLHANEGHTKYSSEDAPVVIYKDDQERVCKGKGDELWLGDLDRINVIVRERWGCA